MKRIEYAILLTILFLVTQTILGQTLDERWIAAAGGFR